MKIKQSLILLAGAVGVALLFFFADTTKPASTEAPVMPGMTGTATVQQVDFATILNKAKGIITPSQRDSVEMIENDLASNRGDYAKASKLKLLGETWLKTGNVLVAATYFVQSYNISKDSSLLNRAANLFYAGFPTTTDTLAKVYGAQEGVKAFQSLAVLDSTNMNYPIREAVCNIDGLGNVMEGVSVLKDVERKDPDNIQMNLILGTLAVVSGQYDKAVTRLEKLVKLDPTNAEAYYHLAEAYRALGRKDDAIIALQRCKQLVNNPDFSAQVDEYINQIKNQ